MNPRLITGDFFIHLHKPQKNMYYAICYVSSANDLLNFEIKELLSSTTNKNLKNNISGILLHNAGNFLQYMEGTKKEVQALYHNHIAKDTRHKDPIVLIEKDIDHRYFDGYDSGFTSILFSRQILLTYSEM
jgi:hypothetical protein